MTMTWEVFHSAEMRDMKKPRLAFRFNINLGVWEGVVHVVDLRLVVLKSVLAR